MILSPTRILLFGGLAALGALLFAGTASAEEVTIDDIEPLPDPTTGDGMPWMRFSEETQAMQERYNEWAAANGWPTITADGILGPLSCEAFTNWWQEGGEAVPSACANAAIYKTCQDAAAVRREWQNLENERISGDPFYDEDKQDALYNLLYKLERMCGDVQITGEGTRL